MNKILLSAVLLLLTWYSQSEAACGYEACPATKPNLINVHLVPHSHDDTGWLKTLDQYYYGSRNSIQRAGVQYILDSVVTELLKDESRRFIYVESAFFFKWYNEQSDVRKNEVKKLVNEGRLVFAGGAWSMNDEAAAHYQSVIDQFTVGLKWLTDTFGSCARPTVGWQIDPFGHSREMASIFSQMGYDGEFFARADWIEKNDRLLNKTAEMIWTASENLGKSSEIFTGILYNHYSAPPGFCFDTLCQDAPFIDGGSADNNVKEKVDAFVAYIEKLQKYYRATHLMVPMGDDFNYENAIMNYKNMDKLIKYVNERQLLGSKINVIYSTPACYLNSVHKMNLTWPTKSQDFFPYSTDWHTYWTGYFSSRPTQKRFERDGNHFLQVAKQLTTFANLNTAEAEENLNQLRHIMGVMQHHDAITGTEKQHVASDYDRMLTEGLVAAQYNTRMALQKLTNMPNAEFESCLQLNISVCEYSQYNPNNLMVTVYNPLAHESSQYVRVPIKNGLYMVQDALRAEIPSQLVPVSEEVVALTHLRSDITAHELVFKATADKLSNYLITLKPEPRNEDNVLKMAKRMQRLRKKPIQDKAVGDVVVQNSLIKLTFNANGILYNVEMNGISENITQELYYYNGALGNNGEFKNRSSGAYIFRPNGTEVLLSQMAKLTVVEGALVKEVHQHFNDWTSQIIRLYEGVNRVEFEWLVGPIPIADNVGKEIITRFSTDLETNGVFYTDANGREMMRRVRNEREYFQANMTEKESGNYYPITAKIALQTDTVRLALLNDRAQGGSSLKDGQLELMLHRRLLHDDAFGVGEALNETVLDKGLVARGKVYLMLAPTAHSPGIAERIAQQEILLPFWKFFSSSSADINSNVNFNMPSFSRLPININVLTLESYSESEILLRLENFMDKNETLPITFDLREIFDALAGQQITETTLDGSLPLSGMKRFKFHADGEFVNNVDYQTAAHLPLVAKEEDVRSQFYITMNLMQIRTFIIKRK